MTMIVNTKNQATTKIITSISELNGLLEETHYMAPENHLRFFETQFQKATNVDDQLTYAIRWGGTLNNSVNEKKFIRPGKITFSKDLTMMTMESYKDGKIHPYSANSPIVGFQFSRGKNPTLQKVATLKMIEYRKQLVWEKADRSNVAQRFSKECSGIVDYLKQINPLTETITGKPAYV